MELVASIIDGFLVELPLACVEVSSLSIGGTVVGGTIFLLFPEFFLKLVGIPCTIGVNSFLACTVFPVVTCAWAAIKGTIGGTAGFIVGQMNNLIFGL